MFASKTGECACGREGRLFQGKCFACWRERWPSGESGENNDNGSASGARATLEGET